MKLHLKIVEKSNITNCEVDIIKFSSQHNKYFYFGVCDFQKCLRVSD